MKASYDEDFFQWAGKFHEIDAAHAADEIEDMGKRALPETALRKDQFPAACPFTIHEILDDNFLPG